jgi:hypothetical protein
VIDIENSFQLKVYDTHRDQFACIKPGQGHDFASRHGANHAAGFKFADTIAILPM